MDLNLKIISSILSVAEGITASSLDMKKIEKFRKDFLTLMKNSKRVSDYDEARTWADAMNRWSNIMEEYIFTYLLDDWKDLMYKGEISKGVWEIWDSEIRKNLWSFVIEARVPVDLADKYWNKDARFVQYEKRLKKWENRIRRLARDAWKTLKEFQENYENAHGRDFEVSDPEEYETKMSGIPVVIRSSKKSYYKPEKFYNKLKKAVSVFVSRSSKRIPELASNALPIIVDTSSNEIDKGGEYGRRVINLYSVGGSPEEIAHVLAHENGHHLWRMIGRKAQQRWEQFISGGKTKLDLNTILDRYGNQSSLYDNKTIKKEDPVLYLQIQGLYDSPATQRDFGDILSMDQLREYLEGGGDSDVSVSSQPISGYASKNSEEAFCEAVGLYSIYGTNAVLPIVRSVLNMILGH